MAYIIVQTKMTNLWYIIDTLGTGACNDMLHMTISFMSVVGCA
jgi:hypothetical protein